MLVVINGRERDFPALSSPATLTDLLAALELKGDRVALEHNGAIVSRESWPHTAVHTGDRFEIVHFVGGGTQAPLPRIFDSSLRLASKARR